MHQAGSQVFFGMRHTQMPCYDWMHKNMMRAF